ncbi:MAG TPA: LuxR C-terminal-related transcriptional regulator [Bryobacteraceae bacterium]|nr:LuxR C-terminal-related transcriptional regulator [Bryobacteraceae bacterium]
MGGLSLAGQPEVASAPSLEALRREGERLRADMVRAQLDIYMTIAGFGDMNVGEKLRRSSQKAAERGCQMVQVLLAMASGDQREELQRKLEWLQARLEAAAPGKNGLAKWEPPERIHEAAPPTVSAEVNGRAEAERLTPREMEVLKYIAEGHSTKQVAEILGITFKTAACHRYRVMDKLGIHETASLVRYAIRQGMVKA